jgi:predicted dehydrogenase
MLGANEVEKRFGVMPKLYKNHEELLSSRDIDAVVIATPDHQHCPHLMDAVNAGKDAYVEKPIATNIDELKQAYDVVIQSKQIVQNGTQGRSSKGALATRAFIQSGQLGKLLRVEESRSHYNPYWNNYSKPKNETETDWKEFLSNRQYRPFDADRHGSWMGYKEFSPNTIGGWMSHFSDFVHFATGCEFPVSAIAHGGIYSPTSESVRTCPDTVTAIVDYPEGFSTLFTTHFGNAANDYTIFFGTKGIMRINEPDGNSDGILPRVSGEGSEHPEKIQTDMTLPEISQKDHMENWLNCIQTREQPNANMEQGYKQGITVLLAETARLEERKMVYSHKEKSFG